MFGSPHAAAVRPQHTAFAAAYARVGRESAVTSATPHALIALLYKECLDALTLARSALAAGQVEAKCAAISRATRIVDEGLRSALDLDGGGRLAEDLHALYGYLGMRLTLANVRNDDATLAECQSLLTPLRDAWRAIAPAAAHPAR